MICVYYSNAGKGEYKMYTIPMQERANTEMYTTPMQERSNTECIQQTRDLVITIKCC